MPQSLKEVARAVKYSFEGPKAPVIVLLRSQQLLRTTSVSTNIRK